MPKSFSGSITTPFYKQTNKLKYSFTFVFRTTLILLLQRRRMLTMTNTMTQHKATIMYNWILFYWEIKVFRVSFQIFYSNLYIL